MLWGCGAYLMSFLTSLQYKPIPGMTESPAFAINLDDNGLFESMVLPDAPKRQQNIMRAWAAMLQINKGKIQAGERAFTSEEVRAEIRMHFDISFHFCRNY